LRRYSWAAWLLAFVFCIRDVETSALLYPPGGEPLSVRLFTLEANGPPAVVSAMAAVLGLLVIIPLAGASLLLRRRA
jgi:iron(III) transport system permease protein